MSKGLLLTGLILWAGMGGGCTPKLLPLPPAPTPELARAGFGQAASPQLVFAARQGEVEPCKPGWDKLFIPLEVRIENRSGERLSFQPEDFILRDENGRQYQAVEARELAALGAGEGGRRSAFFTFGLICGPEGGGEAWGAGFPLGYNSISRADRCPAEIYLKALSPQPIEAGAFAQGLIYFRGELRKSKEYTLELRKGSAPAEPVKLELRFKSK